MHFVVTLAGLNLYLRFNNEFSFKLQLMDLLKIMIHGPNDFDFDIFLITNLKNFSSCNVIQLIKRCGLKTLKLEVSRFESIGLKQL